MAILLYRTKRHVWPKTGCNFSIQTTRENLKKYGYAPMEGTTGLWSHKTKQTKFALCVDNFGVKYFSKEDAIHLIESLKKHYTISEDWTGSNYCGFKIDWHYDKDYVDISMQKYILNELAKYNHKIPQKRNMLNFSTFIQYMGNNIKYWKNEKYCNMQR